MTTAPNSKTTQLGLLRQMAAGLLKHMAGQTLTLGGTPTKVDDLLAKLDTITSQEAAAEAAKTTWKQLVATSNKSRTGFSPTMKDLRRYLQGLYGVESPTLLDFGMTPEHAPVKTVAAKAGALVKSAATREARHTMTKKQKAAIHGTVAPAATAAPATPAAPTAPVAPNTTGGKTS